MDTRRTEVADKDFDDFDDIATTTGPGRGWPVFRRGDIRGWLDTVDEIRGIHEYVVTDGRRWWRFTWRRVHIDALDADLVVKLFHGETAHL